MPSEFAEMGVRFQYPESWALVRDEGPVDCRSVTVTSPEGGFWVLSIHPPSSDPARLVDAVLQAMREDYKELESEEIQDQIGGHACVGRNVNFYCFDLTNTAWIRGLQTDQATYAVFCQAEDREFDRVADVFRAMTLSFLGNLPGS